MKGGAVLGEAGVLHETGVVPGLLDVKRVAAVPLDKRRAGLHGRALLGPAAILAMAAFSTFITTTSNI